MTFFYSLINQLVSSTYQLVALAALLLLPLLTALYQEVVLIRHLPKGGFSLPHMWRLFVRFLQSMANFLQWQQPRQYWGTVYDSVTKEPIDPVLVELIHADTGHIVEQAITDLSGQYGFLAYPGRYLLRARRSHYQFPSTKISGQRDDVYENLYHGGIFTINEGMEVIAPNIPLDPIEHDFNQEAKQRLLLYTPRSQKILNLFFRVIFWIGFAFAIWSFFTTFSSTASAISLVYLLLLAVGLRPARKRLWGRVLSAKIGEPMPGMRLELRVPNTDVLVGKAMTGVEGRFFLKANPGKYELSVSKIYTGRVSPVGSKQIEIGRSGLLNKDVYV